VPVRLSPPNDGYRSTSIEMIGVGEGGRTCLAAIGFNNCVKLRNGAHKRAALSEGP
jgi:hypothetical protein